MDSNVIVGSDEYRERFVEYLVKGREIDRDMAEAELEATIENVGDGMSCPETDADEELSYWTDD